MKKTENSIIESFEVTKGGKSGDMLSDRKDDRKLTVGLFACGYFEYWRMYPGLKEKVEADMQKAAARLGKQCNLVYPGFVDTLDLADNVGQIFKKEMVDVLIITEGTYCPDYFVHQALGYLNEDIPLCLFASQAHTKLDYTIGYDESLRNSGPMGIVQLSGGFRKMGKYENYEIVTGGIDDNETYKDIERYIQVRTTIANLKNMTIGLIGHVFRGMYDFHYDKTAVSGVLGPEIIDIDIPHLTNILGEIKKDDERVTKIIKRVYNDYQIEDLSKEEISCSARLAVAFEELVERYRLHGLVLLGQHFIETQANSTCHLGVSELLRTDKAIAVTEGDVLGCIMSKVLKDFSGCTPFFGEWEEIDTSLNAVMFLGHGFVDPRQARNDRPVKMTTTSENWGFVGNSVGFEATYQPGIVTITHIIHDSKGWRIFISEGELLDTPPLKIHESTLIVKVKKNVKDYFRDVMKFGFSHHAVIVNGSYKEHLKLFAEQLGLEINEVY